MLPHGLWCVDNSHIRLNPHKNFAYFLCELFSDCNPHSTSRPGDQSFMSCEYRFWSRLFCLLMIFQSRKRLFSASRYDQLLARLANEFSSVDHWCCFQCILIGSKCYGRAGKLSSFYCFIMLLDFQQERLTALPGCCYEILEITRLRKL